MGQFILTSSAVPDKEAEKEREHSGTGRFAWLTMRPMTLFESGESNGKVSLSNLFTTPERILEKNELKLQDIAFLICRGGWPMAVGLPEEAALEQAFDYYDAVTKEDMPAWNPNLRSKTAIRTTDTRYFVDPSIATAALGLGPADLMSDLKTMGFFFEAMCVRDLRVFAEALNGKVYHYRDKSGLECDAVVHLRNGQYGLIEIKLGGETLINDGVETLILLSNQIDTTRMKAPAFKMILTATGEHAYRRPEDGIYIVPIGCLKD